MEKIKYFTPLATCIIAFVAVMTGLGFVFNLLLGPVKTDVAVLKAGQKEVNAKLDKILAKMASRRRF